MSRWNSDCLQHAITEDFIDEAATVAWVPWRAEPGEKMSM